MRDPLFAPILPGYFNGQLILTNIKFSYPVAIKIAQLLITLPIIRYADLSGCNMCRNSLNIITYALQFNRSLHHLNLGHNNINDVSVKFVVELLNKKSLMSALILNNNLIGDKGVSQLLDTLRSCRVYFLDLSFNLIENSGMMEIAKFAATSSSLVDMNLRWSGIKSTGIAALANACLFNRSITRIHLRVEDQSKIKEEQVVTGLANLNCKLFKEFMGSVFSLGVSGLQNMSLWQLRGFYSNIEMALCRATDLASFKTTTLSIALDNIQSYFMNMTKVTYQSLLPALIPEIPATICSIMADFLKQGNPFFVSVATVSCDNICTAVMLKDGSEVTNFSVHQSLVQVKCFTRLCYENDEKVPARLH